MYNTIEELLPTLISSFKGHTMFEEMEEGDIISVFPLEDSEMATALVDQTNDLLADFFEVEDDEKCYAAASYADRLENPILFWERLYQLFF